MPESFDPIPSPEPRTPPQSGFLRSRGASGLGGPPQAAAGPGGLVERETSHVSGPVERVAVHGRTLREVLAAMSRRRRIQRMRTSIRRFADCAHEGMADGGRRVGLIMATLTYRDADGWEAKHISAYVQRTVEWLRRRRVPYAYAWVIEMQKRGAPHYHVLWWVPREVKLPKPDEGPYPSWRHGSSRIEWARSPGYIVKYSSKGDDMPLPFGARLFGMGACVSRWRRVARWAAMPKWLRQVSSEGDVLSRVTRLGWLNRDTGELHASPYRFGFERDETGWWVWIERWRGGGAGEEGRVSEGVLREAQGAHSPADTGAAEPDRVAAAGGQGV